MRACISYGPLRTPLVRRTLRTPSAVCRERCGVFGRRMDRGGGRVRRTTADRRPPRGPLRGRRPFSLSTIPATEQQPLQSGEKQHQPDEQQLQQPQLRPYQHLQQPQQPNQQLQQRIVIGAETTTGPAGPHRPQPRDRTRLPLPTPKCQREDGDGVEDGCDGGGVGLIDETELLAKLRCPSESAEVIAEREKRRLRRRRCPDYPGLALSSSVFSTETGMKFSIIRNELHNVLKPQLRRVSRCMMKTVAAGGRLYFCDAQHS